MRLCAGPHVGATCRYPSHRPRECLFVQFLSPLLELLFARGLGQVLGMDRSLQKVSMIYILSFYYDEHTGAALWAIEDREPPEVAPVSSWWCL